MQSKFYTSNVIYAHLEKFNQMVICWKALLNVFEAVTPKHESLTLHKLVCWYVCLRSVVLIYHLVVTYYKIVLYLVIKEGSIVFTSIKFHLFGNFLHQLLTLATLRRCIGNLPFDFLGTILMGWAEILWYFGSWHLCACQL